MSGWDSLWKESLGVPPPLGPDHVLDTATALASTFDIDPPSVEEGRVLRLLAGEPQVRRILQLGGGCGYRAISMVRGFGRPELLRLEPDATREAGLRRLFETAEVADRVSVLVGDPLEAMLATDLQFDLVHVGPSPESRRLLDAALTRIDVGGVVAMSSIAPARDSGGAGDALSGYFLVYPQLDAVVLPVGGGLAVGRKVRALVTDCGGPF